jgi:hypothetical protein
MPQRYRSDETSVPSFFRYQAEDFYASPKTEYMVIANLEKLRLQSGEV